MSEVLVTLVTVYAFSIGGRDIQIIFSEDIFLDEQPEMIGKTVIDAWKLMAKDRPAPPVSNVGGDTE